MIGKDVFTDNPRFENPYFLIPKSPLSRLSQYGKRRAKFVFYFQPFPLNCWKVWNFYQISSLRVFCSEIFMNPKIFLWASTWSAPIAVKPRPDISVILWII